MHWIKLGQIYKPQLTHPKLLSHAANPLALHLLGDVYRVYFNARDDQKRSSVGFVDIDIIKQKVVYIHDKPVFVFGDEFSFYSHGVSIGNCYEVEGQKYILFMGWQCPANDHWRGEIGRLRVNQDFSLTLDNSQPLMPLDEVDNISLSYPWVQRIKNKFFMWYGTTITWDAGNGEMIHTINLATSNDGLQWEKHGLAIPYEVGVAQAFSRPTMIVREDGLHMWFSYRSGTGQKYRIGYAYKSLNQTENPLWELDLNSNDIDVSEQGWDSEMIEYPYVFSHKQKTYMLYNGNDYGLSGFGLAVLHFKKD